MNTITSNPWRTAVIALAILVPTFLAVGAGTYALRHSRSETPPRVAARAEPAATPTPAVVEDCNRYAAAAQRDTGRIVRDGAIGGAVGAGVGAAGGAIAKGGEGAGKGAGIGALIGVTVGALRGLSEENRKSETARQAYAECLERRGY